MFILPNYLLRACGRAEIDEIENRKSIEKINSWFFEKVSKIVNLSEEKKIQILSVKKRLALQISWTLK